MKSVILIILMTAGYACSAEDGVASGENPEATDLSARRKIESGCNTLAMVKAYLADNGVEVPVQTGNANASIPAWKRAGFAQITRAEVRPLDICVYSGGSVGTIMVMGKDNEWQPKCGANPGAGYRLLSCLRPPSKK